MLAICTNSEWMINAPNYIPLKSGVPKRNETVNVISAEKIDGIVYYRLEGYQTITAKGKVIESTQFDSRYFIPLDKPLKAAEVFKQVFAECEPQEILN